MISAVLTFGLITAIGEAILISSLPIKMRLKLLGSNFWRTCTHISFAFLNLWIHWGTITGSMTAVVAFVASSFTLWLGRQVYGEITNGVYKPGLINYKELT